MSIIILIYDVVSNLECHNKNEAHPYLQSTPITYIILAFTLHFFSFKWHLFDVVVVFFTVACCETCKLRFIEFLYFITFCRLI